jgi:UDP-glucose:(heptosyl)LPS alpha-1,3-glucosyltransferase
MKCPIILIAETMGRKQGGAEIYLANLAEFIAQSGHPVRVYLRRPCSEVMAPGVDVQVVPVGRSLGFLREWKFACGVKRRLPADGRPVLSTLPLPGITHYQPHSGLYRAAFEAKRESLDAGLRKNFYRLGNRLNLKRRWLMAMQEKLLTREPRPQIMTFSRKLRDEMLSAYGVLASDVLSLPLGVDLGQFCPGPAPAQQASPPTTDGKRLVLLFAGHNFRLKGLHCLLTALGRASQRGFQAELLVVGSERRAEFQTMAGRLGLAPRVRFLGFVKDADMADYYRACDVLVHPTFSDHCSLVVLEALACGRPVITTRQNGAAELMENGRQGIILRDAYDLDTMVEALLSMQDRRKLAAMGEAAAALRPKLDFTQHARQVLAWLTEGRPAKS